MLPIETKDEKPRPLPCACARSAKPSAPLWDEKPIEPGGNACGAKVAFSEADALATPRQFGPIEACSVAPDEREQAILQDGAVAPHLGESG